MYPTLLKLSFGNAVSCPPPCPPPVVALANERFHTEELGGGHPSSLPVPTALGYPRFQDLSLSCVTPGSGLLVLRPSGRAWPGSRCSGGCVCGAVRRVGVWDTSYQVGGSCGLEKRPRMSVVEHCLRGVWGADPLYLQEL